MKLDISIIQGIDTDLSKQHIISNLISYAHRRRMLVVAEGVETPGELRNSLELGADLLQGFALARPAAVPPAMEPTAMNLIRDFHQNRERL